MPQRSSFEQMLYDLSMNVKMTSIFLIIHSSITEVEIIIFDFISIDLISSMS